MREGLQREREREETRSTGQARAERGRKEGRRSTTDGRTREEESGGDTERRLTNHLRRSDGEVWKRRRDCWSPKREAEMRVFPTNFSEPRTLIHARRQKDRHTELLSALETFSKKRLQYGCLSAAAGINAAGARSPLRHAWVWW